ncbi:Snf5p [Kluyveromyces lactis]|uniref:KLLA0E18767p n=1 Tax=Kluyveromyces lactis (strain ATCC 8585 / CBS 2359 / DSM 70799 / NBRC 1267 / NRRL Y-1140 / WM37) TaxID=284590 RepID=Q6CMP0_KLULA|nr:uncharacterized protein KLLA0_E18767g [Kluyveromyces lactis]CAG99886.1 KLLA0E18767p [Kluyveromyces lactis]|eukprot:XP_454799.1 uncharacterized protein KLLA0_E18767g [Kluyveromyces lactis]
MSNPPMNPGNANPLSNIGTPSFSLSQVPQHILQSLTPAQLQMIQQKHQQLLLQRQRQAQQMQQEQVSSPGNMNQLDAAQRAQLMKLKQQQMQRSQTQQQQEQRAQQVQQAQQLQQQQVQQQQQQSPPQSQQRTSLNLPPQIAQLSPALQMQWLQSIKQQAIARNNQNALLMITQLEVKLQQQHRQQQQQQQQPVPPQQPVQQQQHQSPPRNIIPPNQPQLQQPQPQKPRIPLQQQMGNPQQMIGGQPITQNIPVMNSNQSMVPSSQQPQSQPPQPPQRQPPQRQQQQQVPVSVPQPPQPSQAAILQQVLQKFQKQLPDIPKFQTILQDPPETPLPHTRLWSEKERADNEPVSFDTRLYEHVIERDLLDKDNLLADTNGLEPISKFGFSQREVILRLQQDLDYYKELRNSRMQSITNTTQGHKSKSIWGDGYSGYGNGFSNDLTRIQVDDTYEMHLDEIYEWTMNQTGEELVPVRLEFDAEKDKFTLRDTFVWNRSDTLLSINEFVKTTLKDYRLKVTTEMYQQIVNSIKEQLQEYTPNPFENVQRFGGDDFRIKINLDIVVGQHQLIDTVEWDVSNPDNCPESFAECLCEELSLPGEFLTAIAHCIREQVHMYHKSLYMVGYKFDGSPVEEDDIRTRFLPVLTLADVMRPQKDTFLYTPNLLQISPAELERLVKDKDRDTRRKRRQVRFNRRGNTENHPSSGSTPQLPHDAELPDLGDIPKTCRQLLPTTTLPGGIDVGPSTLSFQPSTRVEYLDRAKATPKQEFQQEVRNSSACRVIMHDVGKSLLVTIKLPKAKTTIQ